MSNQKTSYQEFKEDLEKARPSIIKIGLAYIIGSAVGIALSILLSLALFWATWEGLNWGIGNVDDKHNDYMVSMLMLDTIFAIDEYRSENGSYPVDLHDIQIKFEDPEFTVPGKRQISYRGYIIEYINDSSGCRLETIMKFDESRYAEYCE